MDEDQPGTSKKYSPSRRMSEGSNEPNPNDGRPKQLPTGTRSEPATPSLEKPSQEKLLPTLSRRSSSISSYLGTDSISLPNTPYVSPVRPHPAAASSQDREAVLSVRELHLYPVVFYESNPPTPSSDASPARINQYGQIIYNEPPEPPLSEEQRRRINQATNFVQPQPSAAAYGSPLHRPTTSERAEQMQANLPVARLRNDESLYQVIPITNVEVVDLERKPVSERRCCLMRRSNIILLGLGLFVGSLLITAAILSQSNDTPQNTTVTKSMRSPKVFGDSHP